MAKELSRRLLDLVGNLARGFRFGAPSPRDFLIEPVSRIIRPYPSIPTFAEIQQGA